MNKFVILILSLISFNICFAQSHTEISSYENLFKPKEKHEHYFSQNNSNEIKLIFSSLYFFYKNFISSQDISSCSFTPSCSTYSIQSIRKHGVILGTMETFDRLTRCNSLSPKKYEKDNRTGLLIDEVD